MQIHIWAMSFLTVLRRQGSGIASTPLRFGLCRLRIWKKKGMESS